MTIINSIIKELKDLGIKKYAFIKKDNSFFENNFTESTQKIISKIIFNNKDIPVYSYIKKKLEKDNSYLYIYKVADNGFLICISSLNIETFLNKLKQITDQYGFLLFKLFSSQSNKISSQKNVLYTVTEPISAIILSKNKNFVPEPVAWIPSSFDEIEALKIGSKALLILLGEADEIKESYSLIHFINRKSIGLIYLFEIPNNIKSSSATITILFNENIKKAILVNIEIIETEIKKIIEKNIKDFNFSNENLKILHDRIISILNKPTIEKEITSQIKKLDSQFDLKEIMIKEINRIKMPEEKGKKDEKIDEKSNIKSEMIEVLKKVKNRI